jgi:hypothetical protein
MCLVKVITDQPPEISSRIYNNYTTDSILWYVALGRLPLYSLVRFYSIMVKEQRNFDSEYVG